MSRHPKEDTIVYGGDFGNVRIYRIAENQGRTAANNDVNLIKQLERQPGAVHAVAYSPDGSQLAISGYHEVVLRSSDGNTITARLVGLSERIESAVFSPDGTRLAVTGGSPGRMGEVQIWNVADHQLQLA